MKIFSLFGIIILLTFAFSSCGTPGSISSKGEVLSVKNEATGPAAVASGVMSSGSISASWGVSESVKSVTGSEDPEVQAIMNDLDNMFESVAGE